MHGYEHVSGLDGVCHHGLRVNSPSLGFNGCSLPRSNLQATSILRIEFDKELPRIQLAQDGWLTGSRLSVAAATLSPVQ